jgi:hypothetical protein
MDEPTPKVPIFCSSGFPSAVSKLSSATHKYEEGKITYVGDAIPILLPKNNPIVLDYPFENLSMALAA